jgi:hypothetical protein
MTLVDVLHRVGGFDHSVLPWAVSLTETPRPNSPVISFIKTVAHHSFGNSGSSFALFCGEAVPPKLA